MKNRSEPFLVSLEQSNSTTFDVAEVKRAYGLSPVATKPSPTTSVTSSTSKTPSPPPATTSSTFDSLAFAFDAFTQAKTDAAQLPGAIEGQGGDTKAFEVCCRILCGYDLTEAQAFEALQEWNQRCMPPWSDSELKEKIRNAAKYGQEPRGARIKQPAPLVYVAHWDKYLTRFGDAYDTSCSLVATAARKRLIREFGRTKEQANEAISGGADCVTVYGLDCRPSEPQVFVGENGKTMLNEYVPSKIKPVKGAYPVIETILNSVTAGDAAARAWLFNWIAAKIQKPDRLMVTSVVLQGSQGNGKSKLGLVVSHLIGPQNSVSLTQNDLDSSFNPFMTKLFIVANEIYSGENALHMSSILKSYTADTFVSVNAKNRPQQQFRNRTGWLLTTNSPSPVRIEGKHDRRWTVISNMGSVDPGVGAGVSKLFDATEQVTSYGEVELQAFKYDLLGHQVDEVMVRTPLANVARAELAASSQSSTEMFCEAVLEQGALLLIEDAANCKTCQSTHPVRGTGTYLPGAGFIKDDIYAAYCHRCHMAGSKPMGCPNFYKELRQAHSAWCLETQRMVGGRRVRLCAVPSAPASTPGDTTASINSQPANEVASGLVAD
jgi:hypothetical protein